ncbi:S8 family serine peptidase [Flavobacterium sp. SUN046]|uniref:S8 family peptidase n=1 Tax=Flavobacterium sp. SUN046 TaxID=3002440 RepID=UPI002DB7255D|nr:S8 family serine peptidase [Flavobacterium sp. SUN046]MEC4048431.1 S8 family serine peptidase [Flavobacterium sp. SUN046]
MKKIIAFLLFLASSMLIAQNNYYYYNGNKQEIVLDKKHINLFVNSSFDSSVLTSLGLSMVYWKMNEIKPDERWTTIVFDTEPSEIEYLQKTTTLKNTTGVTGVAKHFKNLKGENIGTSNLFFVKLKSIADTIVLKRIAIEKRVTIHHQLQYMPQWFALQRNIESPNDVIELSNQFFETQLFENVDPNFLFKMKLPEPPEGGDYDSCVFSFTNSNCVNDVLFQKQWGLRNLLNPFADINICQAWNISKGANTKIAILDTGVQLNHPDLLANISPFSYDTMTNTSPSHMYTFHATYVAGICSAVSNNTIGMAGVAPNSEIMSISNSFAENQEAILGCQRLATGINWAIIHNADIINNSWGLSPQGFSSAVLENAIMDATTYGRNGKGCIVVFASGNNGAEVINYPANNPNLDLLTIGAISMDGNITFLSSFGESLDLVAPGECIISTTNDSGSTVKKGTSAAAPHVSGVAALMVSVNPCLTRQKVYDIIEQTAQKIIPSIYSYDITPNRTNGDWNEQMGYGLLDALAATQLAKSLAGMHLDLYIKDNITDLGLEPNTTTNNLWNSPNIWVRNNQDGGTVHQTPKFNQSTPNYVYIKIENKSCFATTGYEKVKIYYCKPSTDSPSGTSAAFRSSFVPTTGVEWVLIDTINIPQLLAGVGIVLNVPWTLPDPIGMYGCTSTTFNTSLLVKIVDPIDVLAVPETENILNNIRNNNNIAGKNLIVIDVNYLSSNQSNDQDNLILVANPYNETRAFNIEMIKEDLETGKPIYQEAEVHFKMDEVLYNAWERGGKREQNVSHTKQKAKRLVTNNNVLIGNITLNPKEFGSLQLFFNFLIAELSDKSKYNYHIIQRDIDTNEIVSAVSFEINKESRVPFKAIAGNDIEVDKNDHITISASQIIEQAIYNWYDRNGNLIFEGKDLNVVSEIAEKYKLEVIAIADGFKDYDDVEVKLKPSIISSLSPNIASDVVKVNYKLNEVGSAYLMVIESYGNSGTSENYILDTNSSEIIINISNYPNGFYTMALVCNGKIVDAKTLIKQ